MGMQRAAGDDPTAHRNYEAPEPPEPAPCRTGQLGPATRSRSRSARHRRSRPVPRALLGLFLPTCQKSPCPPRSLASILPECLRFALRVLRIDWCAPGQRVRSPGAAGNSERASEGCYGSGPARDCPLGRVRCPSPCCRSARQDARRQLSRGIRPLAGQDPEARVGHKRPSAKSVRLPPRGVLRALRGRGHVSL